LEGRGCSQQRPGGPKWSPGSSAEQRFQIFITALDEEQNLDPLLNEVLDPNPDPH
jgi:hypothetical protein